MDIKQQQKDNFWSKVQKTDGCWLWTGHKNGGYGRVNLNGKVYLAHRIACLLDGKLDNPLNTSVGAREKVVRHTCDVRNCVNPNHLIVGTQMENMSDAKSKGRKWNGEMSGEKHPNAKLTKKQVEMIRKSDISNTVMADIFGVNRSQIYMIRKNKSWATA